MYELLIELKEGYALNNSLGLCSTSISVFSDREDGSYQKMHKYLKDSKEFKGTEKDGFSWEFNSHGDDVLTGAVGGYWWPTGVTEPRIEWLDRHIELNKPK